MMGKYDQSLEATNRSLKQNPNYAAAWDTKGAALSGLGRYKAALECFNRSIELDVHPENGIGIRWYHKGEALKALGQTSEADEAFAKAKELGYTG